MVNSPDIAESADESNDDSSSAAKAKIERRKIPGNLPYTSSAGVLKKVLDRIPTTEKPALFNADWLRTVHQTTGGSARPVIPILKAAGLLSQTGTPTDLYARFQTEAGRSAAAREALKNAFPEIFKRSQFADRDNEKDLLDLIVAVTGLPKTEAIAKNILKTFQCFQGFIVDSLDVGTKSEELIPRESVVSHGIESERVIHPKTIGLVYNINIVLPETTNIEVYNTIFKSLRGNLLSE